MKTNFDYSQIQKSMMQIVTAENLDKKVRSYV